ncbi:MAG: M14-type cytosolic carboxypeptidase [Pirellulaceae bacterium]|nr:M14-type cytosolic carboxypeptidase [Pirellulaceae bacterium]
MSRHTNLCPTVRPSPRQSKSFGSWLVGLTIATLQLVATAAMLRGDNEIDTTTDQPTLVVDADFANGNGRIESIDQRTRTIRMSPTEHKQRGWACWWYVKVTGIRAGETVTLDVGKAPWATPAQAAYSLDNQNWCQTNRGTQDKDRIVYRQRIDASEAWFAWGPPFTVADANALTEWASGRIPQTRKIDLVRTRGGQVIPAIRVGAKPAGAARSSESPPTPQPINGRPYTIWIQARQHAWEAGSSWVCKGLINWLASDDPRAESLRSMSQLVIVPIMDVDNVLLGAGGKNQAPHDHNRDWSDAPHWPAVRAAIAEIRGLDRDGRFDVFIDLHNPGPRDDAPFFFVTPRELLTDKGRRNLQRLLATAQAEITGPLAFAGESRESGPNYDKEWRRISKNWVSLNTRGHVVAVTLETAWNSPSSTIGGYETVGRQLGLALERYLRTNPRQDD